MIVTDALSRQGAVSEGRAVTIFRNGVPIEAMTCPACGDSFDAELSDRSPGTPAQLVSVDAARTWWDAHLDPVLVSLDYTQDGERITLVNKEEA